MFQRLIQYMGQYLGQHLRMPVALGGGILVGLALFWLMQLLVAGRSEPPRQTLSSATLEAVRLQPDPLPPPRPSAKVAPEEPPASAPATRPDSAALPAPAATIALAAQLPATTTAFDFAGIPGLRGGGTAFAVAGREALDVASGWDEDFDGRRTVPVASVRPRYPAQAARAGLEGWVELLYTIDTNGRVSDIRVIDARPRGVFEEAAVAALAQWLYVPLKINGRAVRRQATQRFDFATADIDKLHLYEP